MEREKILVRDNKGIFLKMFRRKFKDEFDFFGNSFLIENENDYKDYDRSIFVVYDKAEMIDYLKLEKKGSNVLVCLFNKQLYGSLAFLEEINNLILLDESKTKPEIVKDLKAYFKKSPEPAKQTSKSVFGSSAIFQAQFHNFYNALFFLL
ncbi:hypothetical protein SAMN05444397_11711 [Flavobacterium aquidurense]|uniref:Uncharacterized protein n=1 Tax=Flavobacterium frigidimaris TaxID=262320 RepID=A0ABX4BJT4_FLAFR|nr:hypothetical protein [Flavobacterium frigidimaris]OXA75167.1 hypothetical protein B0A65_22395 [Flavobacterium frigidimaris]SDZ66606.1 hypothetical protein SAMN05444397_11711 [Flavobacterium aquidurense]